MDYVIICQVIERINEIGMGDDELSFLLGKPNNYVFGFIVKPSDKNRFHEDQIDLLPYLLDCPFSRIIVNGTPSGDIHLHHTKKINKKGYKGFSHIIYEENGAGTRVIWKKKQAPKGTTRKTNGVLLDLLKQWIIEGYFDQNQNALEIYKKLKAETLISVSASSKNASRYYVALASSYLPVPIWVYRTSIWVSSKTLRLNRNSIRVLYEPLEVYHTSICIHRKPLWLNGKPIWVFCEPLQVYRIVIWKPCHSIRVSCKPVRLNCKPIRVRYKPLQVYHTSICIHRKPL